MGKEIIFHDLGLEGISNTKYDTTLIQKIKEYFLDILQYDIDSGYELEDKYYFKSNNLKNSISYVDWGDDSEVGSFFLEHIPYLLKRYRKYTVDKDDMEGHILTSYYETQSIGRQLFGTKSIKLYGYEYLGFHEGEERQLEIVNDPYTFFETINSYWIVMPYMSGTPFHKFAGYSFKEYIKQCYIEGLSDIIPYEYLKDQIVDMNIMIGGDSKIYLTDIGAQIPRFTKKMKYSGGIKNLKKKLLEK